MEGNYSPAFKARFTLFGDRLGRALGANSLTPADVSGRLRISTQMVGKYLRGESLPSPRRMLELSELVGVTVDQLLEGIDTERQPRTPQALRLLQNERLESEAKTPLTRNNRGGSESILQRDLWGNLGDPHQPRPEQIIIEEVADWATNCVSGIRPDAFVSKFPRIDGPLFKYRPDLMIEDDLGPLLAVEVKGGNFFDRIPMLAGLALNWQKATRGAPLIVCWVLRESRFNQMPTPGDVENRLRPFIENQLITDFIILDTRLPDPITSSIEMLISKIRTALKSAQHPK